jgi:hypothetical protein
VSATEDAARRMLTSRLAHATGDAWQLAEPTVAIRLVGTPGVVSAGVAALRQVLDVVSVSAPRAARHDPAAVRVYVVARPGEETPPAT